MKTPSRRSVIAGLGAAGLSACAQTAPLCSPPKRTDDLIWGVNGHPFQAYPGIPLEGQLELLCELGLSHYRVGNRNNGLAKLYPLAERYDMTLLPLLHPPVSLETAETGEIYESCRHEARFVSRQHRGRFPVWECGNELENFAIIQPCERRDDGRQYPCEWGPASGLSASDYYGPRWEKVSAALKGLLDGVAEGDPDARRAIGSAGFGHLGAHDRMAADGLDWDITVWHDYPKVTEEYLQHLAGYGKPIWITEFNAGAWNAVSEEDNARQLKERIAWYRRMREPYGLEAAFIYELLDEPYWSGPESKMGLYRMEGSKEEGWRIGEAKPAGRAVKAALASP